MKQLGITGLALLLLLPAAGCVGPRYRRPVYRPTPAPTPGRQSSPRQTARSVAPPPDSGVSRSRPSVQHQTAPRPANQAVARLSSQSDMFAGQGKLKKAAQSLEQGLRIAPKDALLWSKLARIRLLQHRFSQAVALARKSNRLARGNSTLLQRNSAIITQAQNQ